MKKIAVTGGAGYIGSFIVRGLEKNGFEPVILDNFSAGHRDAVEGYTTFEIDLAKEPGKITEIFEKQDIEGVIHMASFIQMGESFKNPSKYFHGNITVALNVLDACVQNSVKSFVLSSTAGVYGNPDGVPIDENSKTVPLNPYGETKLMIEKILHWYEQAHGVRYGVIRYFNAAGASNDGSLGEDHPDESHIIPLVIKAILEGKEFTLFGDDYTTADGTCVRDYIHVEDLTTIHVKALLYLFDKNESFIVNAGVGEGYSNKQIIDMIEKVSGKRLRLNIGPRRQGDADALFARNDKARSILDWEPQHNLESIITSAFAWHTQHPNGYKK